MDHGSQSLPLGWALALTVFFVLLNGFFVAAEFALVKVRTARLEALVRQGKRRAKSVLHILGHLDLYLSACQLGITLASLVLGWLAEPAVAVLLLKAAAAAGVEVGDSGPLHVVALVLALSVVTVLHMTIGEQAPKIWAIARSEVASLRIATPLRIFAVVFRPFIWFINVISNSMLRLVGVHGAIGHEGVQDVDELRALLKQASVAGHISGRQGALGENVLRLVDLEVRHVMLPRTDVVLLSTAQTTEQNLETIRTCRHTRLPLCDPDLDAVTGLVHGKDVLVALLGGEAQPDLAALKRSMPVVPDTKPLSELIVELQRDQAHCAVAVDEHGTTVGVVFLEDAVEEIVGPIYDEFDERIAPPWAPTDAGGFEMAGGLPLPEAAALLDLDLGSEEDSIAGHVVALLGRLPEVGETLDLPPWRVTVLALSRRRVARLRFEPVGRSEEPVVE
jgi:CBS domain containing-hemolysin-like protein